MTNKQKKTPLSQRDMKSDFEVYSFQTLQHSPERDLSLILRSQRARQHHLEDKVISSTTEFERVTSSGETRLTTEGDIRTTL